MATCAVGKAVLLCLNYVFRCWDEQCVFVFVCVYV